MQNSDQKTTSSRFRSLTEFYLWPLRVATLVLVLLAVNQAFNFHFFIGYTLLSNKYMYSILIIVIPSIFILIPGSIKGSKLSIPILDLFLALSSVIILAWFIANSFDMMAYGWELAAPINAQYFSIALWIIVFEAARRAGGIGLAIIVGTISLYPLFADRMPGPIRGFSFELGTAAGYHAMSDESIIGIPMRAFSNLVIGFLIFGAALQHTGAGKFFINLAFALLGHIRGGPAKVAIVASGLMGSMSGSVVTNVMTTGVMTIPAMRKIKLSAPFAAGVEACASTGGVLMPPVMGATAFIMANFLETSYANVALAAIIPSFLYFLGLFIQIDARAATEKLKGLDKKELPSLSQTLREGWYYVFAFGLLVYLLLFLRREMLAPFYATPLLILINQIFSPKTRWGIKEFLSFIDSLTKLFAELVGVLAGIGLIVGALSMTGLAGTLVNDLLSIAGGSPIILLLIGAITSFVLGIGMTVTAAYIFLAIVLVPALTNSGLDPLASHMFVMYWGMLSFITPPVALAAFAAASVAQVSPMRAGVEAMRLGAIIYFVPFFFDFNPALLLQESAFENIQAISTALVGVALVSAALQGYLIGVGDLGEGSKGILIRSLVGLSGLTLALPAGGLFGFSQILLLVLTIIFLGAGLLARYFLMLSRQPFG